MDIYESMYSYDDYVDETIEYISELYARLARLELNELRFILGEEYRKAGKLGKALM